MGYSCVLLPLLPSLLLCLASAQAQSAYSIGAIGVADQNGIRLTKILTGGSAARAGLAVDDVVEEINGRPVKKLTESTEIMTKEQSGTKMEIKFLRQGYEFTANFVLDAAVQPQSHTHCELFAKALDAIGSSSKMNSVHALRGRGTMSWSGPTGTFGGQFETMNVYDKNSYYMEVYAPEELTMREFHEHGGWIKKVVTPEFAYTSFGNSITPLSHNSPNTAILNGSPIYVAQNISEYTCESQESHTSTSSKLVLIDRNGIRVEWEIDFRSGRILSSKVPTYTGQVETQYSDWRQLDGLWLPFHEKGVGTNATTDMTFAEYQRNPLFDSALFNPPTSKPSSGSVVGQDTSCASNATSCQSARVEPTPPNDKRQQKARSKEYKRQQKLDSAARKTYAYAFARAIEWDGYQLEVRGVSHTGCGVTVSGFNGLCLAGDRTVLMISMSGDSPASMHRFAEQEVVPRMAELKQNGFRFVELRSEEQSANFPDGVWDIPVN